MNKVKGFYVVYEDENKETFSAPITVEEIKELVLKTREGQRAVTDLLYK